MRETERGKEQKRDLCPSPLPYTIRTPHELYLLRGFVSSMVFFLIVPCPSSFLALATIDTHKLEHWLILDLGLVLDKRTNRKWTSVIHS
jgi:hypothetical protein